MSKRIGLRDVPAKWQAREPFSTYNGTLTGQTHYSGSGRLPQPYADELFLAWQNNDIAYIVYSYATPIAWVLVDGTEVKPPEKYSVTTSKHQGKLYGAPQPGDMKACRFCDQDIQYLYDSRYGLLWWDRGGNEICPGGFQKHLPYD